MTPTVRPSLGTATCHSDGVRVSANAARAAAPPSIRSASACARCPMTMLLSVVDYVDRARRARIPYPKEQPPNAADPRQRRIRGEPYYRGRISAGESGLETPHGRVD